MTDIKNKVNVEQAKQAPANSEKENRNPHNKNRKFDKRNSKGPRGKFQRKQDDIEEKVVAINRVVKTTKGGRDFRFAALVVVGDKKGKVGFGTGKAREVPEAIKKAIKDARRNIMRVKIVDNGTIPHEFTGKFDSGRVLLKPAKSGTGIIAGGPVRSVMELAGISDIYSKSLGSNTPINVIRATMEALKAQRTRDDIKRLRAVRPESRNNRSESRRPQGGKK